MIITIKSLDTMAKVADGKATKIIIPSDLQNVATLGSAIKEMFNNDEKKGI